MLFYVMLYYSVNDIKNVWVADDKSKASHFLHFALNVAAVNVLINGSVLYRASQSIGQFNVACINAAQHTNLPVNRPNHSENLSLSLHSLFTP